MTQQHPLIKALTTIGVLARFEQIAAAAKQTNDINAVKAMLKAFKIEAEAKFKSLALEQHPDRGGDEEAMKELNAAWDIVKNLDVRPRPRPRPQPAVHIRVHVYNHGPTVTVDGGTSATGTYSGFGGGGWVRTDNSSH